MTPGKDSIVELRFLALMASYAHAKYSSMVRYG
jgi:hypothetical protein